MAKLQYKEFKHKVENGTITNLKPYISYSGAFRVLIASKGQHIDELLTYKEPDVMVELIKNGYASEHYEEWKTHKDKRVREALAQQGFWPEVFIEDENRDVRAGVVMAHPELMRRVQNSEPEWEAVKDIIENDANVTIEDLDFFLSLPQHGGYDWKANKDFYKEVYNVKRTTLQTTANTLEATMKVVDLYKIGNPLWARGLTITQIRNLLSARICAQTAQQEQTFIEVFDELLKISHDSWETYCTIQQLVGGEI